MSYQPIEAGPSLEIPQVQESIDYLFGFSFERIINENIFYNEGDRFLQCVINTTNPGDKDPSNIQLTFRDYDPGTSSYERMQITDFPLIMELDRNGRLYRGQALLPSTSWGVKGMASYPGATPEAVNVLTGTKDQYPYEVDELRDRNPRAYFDGTVGYQDSVNQFASEIGRIYKQVHDIVS